MMRGFGKLETARMARRPNKSLQVFGVTCCSIGHRTESPVPLLLLRSFPYELITPAQFWCRLQIPARLLRLLRPSLPLLPTPNKPRRRLRSRFGRPSVTSQSELTESPRTLAVLRVKTRDDRQPHCDPHHALIMLVADWS